MSIRFALSSSKLSIDQQHPKLRYPFNTHHEEAKLITNLTWSLGQLALGLPLPRLGLGGHWRPLLLLGRRLLLLLLLLLLLRPASLGLAPLFPRAAEVHAHVAQEVRRVVEVVAAQVTARVLPNRKIFLLSFQIYLKVWRQILLTSHCRLQNRLRDMETKMHQSIDL